MTGGQGGGDAPLEISNAAAEPPARRRRWPWIVALVLLVPSLLVAAGAGAIWHRYTSPGPLAQARDVIVPRGGLSVAADTLTREGVITDPLLFRLAAMATHKDGELRAGEFAFPPAASPRDVLNILRTARFVQHRLTIPEGLTAKQITAILARGDILAGDVPPIEEGSLLPQTYAFERAALRASLAARAKAAMDKALADAWAGKAPDLPLANPREALILASIVERETARPEERPHVAAVFLNRLRLGMRLQSDPTVVYAASDGLGVLDHPITRAELDRDSPYNTYVYAGLPPTPIALPGVAALHAALHPAATDALYFVARGDGSSEFTSNLAAHERAVDRFQRKH